MYEYLVSPTTFTDKKSRCPKLLIWAPLKILYRTLRRNVKEKYPKQLLFSSIKAYWKKAGEKIKN
jgi:hypothetical protein